MLRKLRRHCIYHSRRWRPGNMAATNEHGVLRLHALFSKSTRKTWAPGWKGSRQKPWLVTMRSSFHCFPQPCPSKQKQWSVKREENGSVLGFCEISFKAWRSWTYLLSRRTVCLLVAAFCACTEEVEDCVQKTKMFEVEQTPLFNSCGPGYYLQDPRLMHLRHTNAVE